MIFLEYFPPSCAIPGPNGRDITTCNKLHRIILTENVDDENIRAFCNTPWNIQSNSEICSSPTPGLIRDTCHEMYRKFSGKKSMLMIITFIYA